MSAIEEVFAHQVMADGLPNPAREFIFHHSRKWRFDFAWIEKMVAVEIEGGVYSGGRHTRGAGFEKDIVKYNSATEIGWAVYRFTPKMVNDGTAVDTVRRALGYKPRYSIPTRRSSNA